MSVPEGGAMQAGLLMEAAQTQQQLVQSSLERLRAHTSGLDEVVRSEIHDTLVEELHSLVSEVHAGERALRALQRAAGLRITFVSLALMSLAAVLPLLVLGRVLPTPAELEALRARRALLEENIARLRQAGGTLELRRCGAQRRLCVRVERSAAVYGAERDFLIVKDQ